MDCDLDSDKTKDLKDSTFSKLSTRANAFRIEAIIAKCEDVPAHEDCTTGQIKCENHMDENDIADFSSRECE